MPSSAQTIRDKVMRYAEIVEQNIISDLNARKKHGQRFSVSVDEWTSIASKRFLNLNIHCRDESCMGRIYNLGLARITENMTADKCESLVREHLSSYEIPLDSSIVAVTSDYCSMMAKFGKQIPNIHQPCYAHGIHLAVCDLLYAKNTSADTDISARYANSEDLESEEEPDSEGLEIWTEDRRATIFLKEDIHDAVNTVRKIVNLFEKSPTHNDKLQTYIMKDYNKILIGDLKTRWNSLLQMVDRFLLLQNCVKKLIDCDIEFKLSNRHLCILRKVVEVLKPVEVVVNILGKHQSTLLAASACCKLLVQELSLLHDNPLASELTELLKKRIGERKQDDITMTMNFLNGSSEHENFAQWNTIKYTILQLVSRLRLGNLSTEECEPAQVADSVKVRKYGNVEICSQLFMVL